MKEIRVASHCCLCGWPIPEGQENRIIFKEASGREDIYVCCPKCADDVHTAVKYSRARYKYLSFLNKYNKTN